MFPFLCRMKYCLGLLLIVLLYGCNNQTENQQKIASSERSMDNASTNDSASNAEPGSTSYLWRVTPDYKKIRNTDYNPALATAENVIKGLNENYESVYLEEVKISNDTIYTAIKDATHLTEQMGTTGAEVYLADVVLNLTAVPGIKYVNIQLEEGSHMQPGVWSLADFTNYVEQK